LVVLSVLSSLMVVERECDQLVCTSRGLLH
jgi:hypothetical protein